jgi:NAD-dependent deacetylase
MRQKIPGNVRRNQRRHQFEQQMRRAHGLPTVPNVVFFTGAGISLESGIATFRGENGLWNQDHARQYSHASSVRSDLVGFLSFHNNRRRAILNADPNRAHQLIAELQSHVHVKLITQNIDDLHERAGSKNIVHLHGSVLHSHPIGFPHAKYQVPWSRDLAIGDRCTATGSQLRPDIVLFGERVRDYYTARHWLSQADIVIVIGTSLQVEPAASLLTCIYPFASVYYINPQPVSPVDLPFPGEQIIGGASDVLAEFLRNVCADAIANIQI